MTTKLDPIASNSGEKSLASMASILTECKAEPEEPRDKFERFPEYLINFCSFFSENDHQYQFITKFGDFLPILTYFVDDYPIFGHFWSFFFDNYQFLVIEHQFLNRNGNNLWNLKRKQMEYLLTRQKTGTVEVLTRPTKNDEKEEEEEEEEEEEDRWVLEKFDSSWRCWIRSSWVASARRQPFISAFAYFRICRTSSRSFWLAD